MPILYEPLSFAPGRVKDTSAVIIIKLLPTIYNVVVKSEPSGVPFRVNGIELVTPTELGATEESYTLYFPPTFEGIPFKHWEDGSTEPVRTIHVDRDLTLTATYKLPWYKQPWAIGLGIIGGACGLLILLHKAKR